MATVIKKVRPMMNTRASPQLVLAIVCAGVILANLDLFVVNIALPNIAADLGETDLGLLSWVLNAYAIVYAALLIFFGKLAERHRRERAFLWGVAVFTVASAACALADSVASLIAFRVVQAAGAALLTPSSVGLILASYPPEQRSGAVRVWAAVGGFAAALGPIVGGFLLGLGWRWIFLINLPIGLLALWVGALRLPKVPGHDAPVPKLGAALAVTVGSGAMVLFIIKWADGDWSASTMAGLLGLAVLSSSGFVVHCLRAAQPFVDPALFRIRAFTRASLCMLPFSTAFGAFLLSLVLWQERVWHWDAFHIGLAIAPGPLMVPITSLLVAGRLIKRWGDAPVAALGLVVFALGVLVWTVGAPHEPSPWFAYLGVLPSGVGVGLTVPTLMGMGTAALPPSSFSTGSGVLNMLRQIGFALGVAIFVAIVGTATDDSSREHAFRLAWWVMAGITAMGLLALLAWRTAAGVPTAENH